MKILKITIVDISNRNKRPTWEKIVISLVIIFVNKKSIPNPIQFFKKNYIIL